MPVFVQITQAYYDIIAIRYKNEGAVLDEQSAVPK